MAVIEKIKAQLSKKKLKKRAQREIAGKIQQKQLKEKPWPDILSPEGVLVLVWAVFLDFLGLIGLIPVIGQILSYIPDVLGIVTIGIYDWRKTGQVPLTQKLKKFFTKKAGARIVFELIPVVGILPLWTVYVIRKMNQGK